MNGPDDSMAYYEKLFHSPPPTVDYVASLLSARSEMRVNQNQRKKVDVGAHRALLTKFREVHYINFISR